MAPRCRQFRRATPPRASSALRRTYQTSEFYNTCQLNSQLTYGPGLRNTMELGSYLRWHTNRTSWSRLSAWQCPAALHGGNGLDQVVTRTNTGRHRFVNGVSCPTYTVSELCNTNKSYTHLWAPSRGHPPWPGLQSTYWTPLSDRDSAVLDVDLRV